MNYYNTKTQKKPKPKNKKTLFKIFKYCVCFVSKKHITYLCNSPQKIFKISILPFTKVKNINFQK